MAAATAFMSALGMTLAFGLAGPAQAGEPVMEGVYSYNQEGLSAETWGIYPSCVPTVGDLREPLELAVACRLHVETTRGTVGGDARLVSGQWTYSTPVLKGIKCADGKWASTNETYKFDDVTLTGTRTVANNADCGLAPALHTFPFTLTYKGPLPIPVERYPLICDNFGVRLCS
ncbi:hypothetical protein [Mycolicibacterium frederiksbergense]|nr:hypothetical protein [Mycolicibacterium frederiksbergense]